MQFVSDYMKAIDFIALAALVVIAAASLRDHMAPGGGNRRGHLGCKSVVWLLLTNS